jgi:ferredoxin
MSAGLRAAESIDRYIRGEALESGRSLEAQKPVEVNIEERKATPYRRAAMPALPLTKRQGNYEETNLGLSEEMAKREAGRCLNCAICCECMECEQACELNAVFHLDTARPIDIETECIINFVSPEQNIPEIKQDGIYNVAIEKTIICGETGRSSSIALSAAIDLRLRF